MAKSCKLFIYMFLFVFLFLFCLGFVSATGTDCYLYNQNNGGTKAECNANNCLWTNNDTTDSTIDAVNYWCDYTDYCCVPNECWVYDRNEAACTNVSDALECTWDAYSSNSYPNGTTYYGMCYVDAAGGGGNWSGTDGACWQYDGDSDTCTDVNNAQKCTWNPNSANQNPWCAIKNIYDAQINNPDATSDDVGCCEVKGCWSYDGNGTQCAAAFGGLCSWFDIGADPWCPDPVGCCYQKMCDEIEDAENCTKLATDFYMPCTWDGSDCTDWAGGSFYFYNDSDSCMSTGGWWNASGDCEMPTADIAGTGGYMFMEEAHCWFADNQPQVCRNITGCVYCNDTGVLNNIESNSGTSNESSACYNNPVGFCQGHQTAWVNPGESVFVYDIDTSPLNCTHIQIKSACSYGPLPFCKWENSSTLIGAFCKPGAASVNKATPPVTYCEHPDAINNYSLCKDLSVNFMMPCKWGNVTSNKTAADNCTFNSNAVFGYGTGSEGEQEYEIISSEMLCVAAGGTWKNEYYLEDGALKQDAWCEKGALYDYATGQAAANKGNCDIDCWACDFNSTGQNHGGDRETAELACNNSNLGYCKFTADTNAPNTLGWCDYPKKMQYGSGDCQSSCKDCGLMGAPYSACIYSAAGCKWVNDTDSSAAVKLSTGVCVDNTKKTCDDDCFSCNDFYSCNITTLNCQWDDADMLCKPDSYDGEICFNSEDDDGDGMIDCGDPDCSFDTSCGGSSFGMCSSYTDETICIRAIGFGDQNCTWYNMSWEPIGHCGMPGENCWEYSYNMTLCGEQTGCNNATGGDFNSYCDINLTLSQDSNCYDYTGEEICENAANCSWKKPMYGDGYCGYWLHILCDNYSDYSDSSACDADGNCTWNPGYGAGGFCQVDCFNTTMVSQTACETGVINGICEWRGSSDMCVPQQFEVIGSGGTGAAMGCAQFNGNRSACITYNNTCSWWNDTDVNNNASSVEPDGWCDSKGEYDLVGTMKGEPTLLGHDEAEGNVFDFVDITGFGIRVTEDAYGFVMGLVNVSDAALCNGMPLSDTFATDGILGSGKNKTEFYWYLDTDGDSSSGTHCSATAEPTDTASYTDFEFYISYIVENTTDGLETGKYLYRCVLNSTSSWEWVKTNTFVTDSKKFACFETGAVFVSIEKEGLENFGDLFNISAPMRVFATSSDGNDTTTTIIDDSVSPSYYTPGTVDFEFLDCGNPNVKDVKCKNFQKYGFNMMEDCKNGIDDDADGLADCSDMKCMYSPVCNSIAFNFSVNADDKKTPTVVYSKVERMADAALVMFDTDEPSNGTLRFYKTSSTCATLNKTINDLGDPSLAFDDYKPGHRVSLDSDTLGYGLTNGTVYYYKAMVCDPSHNCGTSKCLNFTTKKANKNFIFSMDVPDGYMVDIPALDYSGNFTTNISDKVYDIGIKTNASITKNMNVTVTYNDLSIKFIGVDLYKPKSLDLETAFIIDTDNGVLGMNSSSKSWNLLIDNMGLGGADDYLELNFTTNYDDQNTLHWYDDDLSTATDVSDFVECGASGASGGTACKVPASLGFSVYGVSTAGGAAALGGGAIDPQISAEGEEPSAEGEGPAKDAAPIPDGEKPSEGEVVSKESVPAEKAPSNAWLWVIGIVVILLVLYFMVRKKGEKRKR